MSISGFPNTHQYRPNSQRTHLGSDYSIDSLVSRLAGLTIRTIAAARLYNHMTVDDTSRLQFEGLAISTLSAAHLCKRITGHYDPLTLDEAVGGGIGMTAGTIAIISRTFNIPHTPHITDSDLAIRLAGLAISTVAASHVYQSITDYHHPNLQLNGTIGTLAIAHLFSLSAAHLYRGITDHYDPLTLAEVATYSLGMIIGSVGAICLWTHSTQALPRGVRQAGNTGPRLPGDVWMRSAATRDWLNRQPNTRDRDTAAQRIRQCMNDPQQTSLSFFYLNITSLPDNLNLPNLTRLDLHESPITHLPDNLNLPQLTELDLHGTRITSLPDNLNLPNLRILSLIESQIRSLPNNLNLPNLTVLSLSRCPITSLPDHLHLPQLTELNLAGSPITSLPDHLHLPRLTELDLHESPITSLPDHLNLPQLTELYLTLSQFRSLPDNLNLPRLAVLRLWRSQIRSLPNNLNLPNLREFDLRGTQITGDYEGVFNLPRECRVLITRSDFSDSIQARINELQTHGGYDGPRFEFHG